MLLDRGSPVSCLSVPQSNKEQVVIEQRGLTAEHTASRCRSRQGRAGLCAMTEKLEFSLSQGRAGRHDVVWGFVPYIQTERLKVCEELEPVC